MKNVIIIVLITLKCVTSEAQDFPNRDGKIFYEFIDTTTTSKDTLFNKTKEFIATFYTNAKQLTQVDDLSTGKIVLKTALEIEEYEGVGLGKHIIVFTLDLAIKDRRIRLQAYDFKWESRYDLEIIKKVRMENKPKKEIELFQKVIHQINSQINYLHKSLGQSLKKDDAF